MKVLVSTLLVLFAFTGRAIAAEDTTGYPLWDNVQTIGEYANLVHLPVAKTLNLGNGIELELLLVPAGKFSMGISSPAPVEEELFNKKILMWKFAFILSGALFLGIVLWTILQKFHSQKLQVSLLQTIIVTFLLGLALLSSLYWSNWANRFASEKKLFATALARIEHAEDDERPVHSVIISHPFYLGKFEVTRDQYLSIIRGNSVDKILGKYPIESVNWFDAQAFCDACTRRANVQMRLPTEAEWEFACRAGTQGDYCLGDSVADLTKAGWFSANSTKTIHPVGLKMTNQFGICDMHGNVSEWCSDWYGEGYYAISDVQDPKGPSSGENRVFRGGRFFDGPKGCRASARDAADPNIRDGGFGFRVVVQVSVR